MKKFFVFSFDKGMRWRNVFLDAFNKQMTCDSTNHLKVRGPNKHTYV